MSGLRILHLEDSPLDAELIREELVAAGLEPRIERVQTGDDFRAALARGGYDLILADYQLPAFDGNEALEVARRERPLIPFFFVSGAMGEENAIEALKQGATDYVLKDRLGRLAPSSRRALAEARDRAELRRAEQELRDSERRFRQLAEAMPQIVWTARADGEFDYFNQRWHDLTGILENHGGVDVWTAILHPEDVAQCIDPWRASVSTGDPYESEYRLRDRDGVYRWHLGRALPARDASGEIVKWFGTCTNIDDQKRVAQELAAAKEAAEGASRAKDQFLAMLSHELRTPLTPVLLDVTAILDDPHPPADLRPTLEMIRRNVQLEARLIDDLLDVTRILRGKMIHSPLLVDVHELIRQAVGICRGEIHAGRLALRADLRATEHHAHADPARLQQVFWNLIKNALKFTPAGGSVMIRSFNRAPGRFTIEVEDTGVGIDPEVLPRIFNPFEQGEMSLTRRFGGLGLGLAISKSIIDTHGGAVSARSPGLHQGSTFSIELATARAPAAAPPQPPISVGAPRASARSILLVEDDPATSQVMERLLRRGGHAVTAAATFADGMRRAEAGSFDVIISDIGLPDGTGLDLMTQIRRRQATPAIALTGYGMDADVERCREAGFDAHLTKPIDYPKLEALIQSLANQQRG